MLKLYYRPGTCSLSPHIVLYESGLPFQAERVDTKAGVTEHGRPFREINPKGYVPALQMEDGSVLTEGPAIVQYIADLAPNARLAPPAGTVARARLQEALNYIATELHKGLGPLFNPKAPDEWKAFVREQMTAKLTWLDGEMARGGPYMLGDTFTVADAYLFTVTGWLGHVGLLVSQWPALAAYRERIAARPAVDKALRAEGLKK